MMDLFADPVKFYTLSFGDKMLGSTITMIMGMGITFIILFLLWGCVGVMGAMLKKGDKKKGKKLTEPEAAAPAAVAAPAAAAVAAPADDALMHVIIAAISAYGDGGSKTNLVVRKIQRLSGPTTTWENAGHRDCTDSRRM